MYIVQTQNPRPRFRSPKRAKSGFTSNVTILYVLQRSTHRSDISSVLCVYKVTSSRRVCLRSRHRPSVYYCTLQGPRDPRHL